MTAIAPIPATRVSDLLTTQRLNAQLQADEIGLQQLESQVSTGQRLTLPSDDPTAAAQAINLNRLIQQKTQIKNNLDTNQSYLTETDTALGNVANLLSNARSTALSVAGTVADSSQRQTAAQVVASAIQQLTDIGNQSFNGRYLFAGSQAGTSPFQTDGSYVKYVGNAEQLTSLSDISQLFQTNVSGADAFGALSTGVSGAANLTPNVTADTRLSDLDGGQGVNKGSITISDGAHSSVVDLSNAVTLGDVANLIESHPPLGRTLRVDITSTGLNVSLDAAGGGNLTITEVGNTTTAAQLGILSPNNVGTAVVGKPLNPQLTLTTSLSDILGSQAQANLISSGSDKDIVIQANNHGAAYNGFAVHLIDDHTVTVGSEKVNYDAVGKTITIDIASGLSTAKDVVHALNNNAAFSADFTAALDPAELKNDGSGTLDTTPTATTAGGSGVNFDSGSGLQIANGGQTYTIDTSGDHTVEDLLNTLNGSPASLSAEINSSGNGINIRSRLSGSDFSIGENGGSTAAQLGVRTFNGSTLLTQLNYGIGIHTATSGTDFIVQRPDGYQLKVTVGSAKTIQDVINLINNDPNNQVAANKVTAQLASTGNGIVLTTTDPSTVSPLAVIEQNGSTAAQDLGLVPAGQTQSNPATASGGTTTIAGADVNPQETDSAFNALIRLKSALENNDTNGINRAIGLLDGASSQLDLTRADLGAREQTLNTVSTSLATEQDNLQSSLSNTVDVDMASAITNLTALQTSFTATLQMTAQISKLTLLNYL
ncbi:MAG TPA: flagellar hook-associated protein FlgL [Pirellulales bacterium]|jgi:flagellar hook-associated protein 3 FlgL|nr:flagellar hook-associated protein FlgL [Pirellulales bacterium]